MQHTGALYQAYFQGFIYVAFLATDINFLCKVCGKVELTLFTGVRAHGTHLKYTPMMTLRVETAGAPQIPSARGTKSACGRRASAVGMLFYEIVETAQAILISYILIDGSAQAVSHVVGFISAWIKSLR